MGKNLMTLPSNLSFSLHINFMRLNLSFSLHINLMRLSVRKTGGNLKKNWHDPSLHFN